MLSVHALQNFASAPQKGLVMERHTSCRYRQERGSRQALGDAGPSLPPVGAGFLEVQSLASSSRPPEWGVPSMTDR